MLQREAQRHQRAPEMNPAMMNPEMMKMAQEQMSKMSPEQMQKMQEMARGMDPEVMRQARLMRWLLADHGTTPYTQFWRATS